MTPEEKKHRAERARAIYNDDLTQEALKLIEDTVIRKWQSSAIDDETGQRNCKYMLTAVHNFRRFFETAINDQVVDMKLLEQRKKRFF